MKKKFIIILLAGLFSCDNYLDIVPDQTQQVDLLFERKEGRKPKIALMGLAFKPNIDDLRESPAKYIVDEILKSYDSIDYFIVEPNIESHVEYELIYYKDAVNKADIIVFLVAHNEFLDLSFSVKQKIIDFCGIF